MANGKGRIVTKEELEKSGYTNLRDFLNAERGLKRRDDKTPERTEAYKTMEKMRMDRASNMRAQARKADVDMETPEERGAMNLKGFMKDKADEGSFTDENRRKAQLDSARVSSQAGRYGTMKKGGAVKMKAGGMAHKKGRDGIASRGKTKGRMV